MGQSNNHGGEDKQIHRDISRGICGAAGACTGTGLTATIGGAGLLGSAFT
jgi:hypothetical protein